MVTINRYKSQKYNLQKSYQHKNIFRLVEVRHIHGWVFKMYKMILTDLKYLSYPFFQQIFKNIFQFLKTRNP